ncbi:ABC transporter permease [Mycobacterium sp. MS1601]|uniref:ABC transporter permease n=1 Tax=Mycobacterium sp. MS1601 TaxID=1936029 RepID=UPI0009F8FA3E|nr:ABC transporter permease [Mycobacterium sp. MS1601]
MSNNTQQAERTHQPSSQNPPRPDAMGFLREHWNTAAPFGALIVLVVVFTLMNSTFLTKNNGLNILSQSSVLLVLAIAATFPILMGSIDLSIGAIVTLSASVCATLAQQYGAWVFLLCPFIGLICGLANGLLVSYAKLPSFLVTLGTSFTFVGIAKFVTDGRPVPVAVSDLSQWFTGSIFGIPKVSLWAVVALVLTTLIASRTRLGRYMYAIGGNELTSRLSGVPVDRTKVYAFLLTGFLAGAAGLLQVFRVRSSTPDLGDAFLLLAIAAVVMGGTPLSGGVGGPLRTVTGVLIITTLSNGMVIGAVHPFLQTVVQGLVVVIAVAVTLDRKKLDLVK